MSSASHSAAKDLTHGRAGLSIEIAYTKALHEHHVTETDEAMAELPDYVKPPVIEVVLGVQFEPLRDLRAAHIGAYWDTIKDEFGAIEEHPTISHMVERPTPGPAFPSLQVLDQPDLPRTWFIDSSGNRLIQLQRDRFLFNWRKVRPKDEYPRFPIVKKEFFRYWEGFARFLEGVDVAQPEIDQCEVTYVNHIMKGEGWESLSDVGNLFTVFGWTTRSGFLPGPEGVRWTMRFQLPEGQGRLHVDATPVVLPDRMSAIRFTLTARGVPDSPQETQRLDRWFDLAREWIVKGFADLTSKQMDSRWERKA